MINNIVKRHDRLNPFCEAQVNIIRVAAKLFLENGYTKTTFKMIEEESGVKVGNITYHFHSKEELLKVLIEELMDFHSTIIENMQDESGDDLFAYAMEVTAKIALCENNKSAWDLYYSSYNLPQIYEFIKLWAAEKNYNLFNNMLPEWNENDFRNKEIVASGIEFAALKTFCDRNLTLDKKVSVILDSMMMLYKVQNEKRKEVIDKILTMNYEKIAKDMFEKFIKRLDSNTIIK